ncbi:Uncharacterised protein [Candidatus Bilamarchaeum dharawalense]|uniref:Uncharacterized protein n=1 Tax=Candidatus Bilamarchaeum dharawalense TaxID=2885759 RepID=A0A5E4LR21_9ARCH|nr:Uncharacterised protein [Candidatus Bilamarchaeum dharawalense]
MKFFKGQYFSFDAIIAAVIFVLALVALLSYWHSVRSFLDYQNDPISKEAIRVSNLLFAPPSPSPNCADIQQLGFGLSWSDRRVNSSLLNCAMVNSLGNPDWLYQNLSTPYKATLEIANVTDVHNPIILGYDPSTPPVDTIHVVKIRRLGTVVNPDGSTYMVTFDLSLYKEG